MSHTKLPSSLGAMLGAILAGDLNVKAEVYQLDPSKPIDEQVEAIQEAQRAAHVAQCAECQAGLVEEAKERLNEAQEKEIEAKRMAERTAKFNDRIRAEHTITEDVKRTHKDWSGHAGFEFYNPTTGHAVLGYDEHTPAGTLSVEKGYVAKPLIYAPVKQDAEKSRDRIHVGYMAFHIKGDERKPIFESFHAEFAAVKDATDAFMEQPIVGLLGAIGQPVEIVIKPVYAD